MELPEGVTPAGTRGAILRASLALFAESGYSAVSIRKIANEVGITSASLYAHYRSKDHILAELVLTGHRELHARLTNALAAAEPTAVAQLSALVRAHVLLHTDFPLLAVVTNSELHALPDELAAPALELRASCSRLLLDTLELGVRDGVFRIENLHLGAVAIGGMAIQVAQWFGPDEPFTRDEVADNYVHYALRIVGADEGAVR
ncbi:TetR/AcrR family transcriptional regulator [Prescottella agglutinans]|uniref:TetR/AcrR family transcriptional regulator n=1 Tax=Prescottella agglutinans TaxID=1644129 RepID=A0A3S3ALF0_9NOCA|nr:TetR/AcrR family transcriptional regulator [Prescottella agglutinans]